MAKRIEDEHSRWSCFVKWMTGGATALDDAMERDLVETRDAYVPVSTEAPMTHNEYVHAQKEAQLLEEAQREAHPSRKGKVFYILTVALLSLGIIGVLLYTTSFLPAFGRMENPVNNEVSRRYIEEGMQ